MVIGKNRYFSASYLCSFLMILGKHPQLLWKELIKQRKKTRLLSLQSVSPWCVWSPTGLLSSQSKGSEMCPARKSFPKDVHAVVSNISGIMNYLFPMAGYSQECWFWWSDISWPIICITKHAHPFPTILQEGYVWRRPVSSQTWVPSHLMRHSPRVEIHVTLQTVASQSWWWPTPSEAPQRNRSTVHTFPQNRQNMTLANIVWLWEALE